MGIPSTIVVESIRTFDSTLTDGKADRPNAGRSDVNETYLLKVSRLVREGSMEVAPDVEV
jgi:hypothetical protein